MNTINTMYNIENLAQQQFLQLPKLIVYGERYKKLSGNAKLSFSILLDRMKLSIKNNWIDDRGNIYFVYTNKELTDILQLSEPTVIKIKKELIAVDLLEEEKTGRANRLYLKQPISINDNESRFIISEEKIEDKSQYNSEFAKNISKQMKGNKNAEKQKKTDELKKFKSVRFVGENPITLDIKQTNLKNLSPELKKFKPSNNNINNNNITNDTNESYESRDSDKLQTSIQFEKQRQHHFVMRNNGEDITQAREQFEDQRQLTNKLPKENIYDYTKQGIPQKITELIYTFSGNNVQDFKNIIGCIFKAKSYVSKRSKNTIFLEDLAEEDFLELHKVIYRCLHERKTNPNLKNFEGYLMAALIRYFENYGEADIQGTMEFTVPINNWTKKYKDNE